MISVTIFPVGDSASAEKAFLVRISSSFAVSCLVAEGNLEYAAEGRGLKFEVV
jgi:hypothetical protein